MTVLAAIIPVHNGRDLTVRSLAALSSQTRRPDLIVVVDDGSTDGTAAAVAAFDPAVVVVPGDGSLWWSGATELGCREAIERGATHLLLFNNDNCVVDPELCDKLLRCQESVGGLVSAVAIDDGPEAARILHAGGDLRWQGRGISLRRSGSVFRCERRISSCDWLPGTALLTTVDAFNAVGGFRPRRYPQYRGDIDFALRARAAGYSCHVDESAWVINDKSQTGLAFTSRVSPWRFVNGLFSLRSNYNFRESVAFAWQHCPKRWIAWNLTQFYGRYAWASAKTWLPSGVQARVTRRRPSQRKADIDVLHVLWSGRIGGAERYVQRIVATAKVNGGLRHHVCIVGPTGPVAEALALTGDATVIGATHGLDVLALGRFWRSLRTTRPDVVHIHTRMLAAQIVAFAALPRTRWIYTEHAPGALSARPKFRWFYRLFRRRFERFVAIADAMSDAMQALGAPAGRVIAVPHGVTVPITDSRKRRPGRGSVVGVVARLEPEKRIDLFLDAVRIVRRADSSVRGVVVGDGSLRPELEARAAEIGGVEFVGEQEDVVPWLDGFDVFLATSEYEPFGLAVLEAFARGVPVVGMPCPGGLHDLIAAGGHLLDSRRPGDAARVVLELLHDRNAHEQMTARALRVGRARSFESVVHRLESIYAQPAVVHRRPLVVR